MQESAVCGEEMTQLEPTIRPSILSGGKHSVGLEAIPSDSDKYLGQSLKEKAQHLSLNKELSVERLAVPK